MHFRNFELTSMNSMNCIEDLENKIITNVGRFFIRFAHCASPPPTKLPPPSAASDGAPRRSLPVFREQRDCNIAILYPQLVNDAQPRRTAVHAEALLATD